MSGIAIEVPGVDFSGLNLGKITRLLPPPEYVEIGSLKWAKWNVGASGETDYGLFYQWGDAQGYTAAQVGSGTDKKYFGWADYKYGNGTSSPDQTGMTKYNSTDGLTTLELTDDAVNAAYGGNWRMPTSAEFQTLDSLVNTAWTTDYQGTGVAGLVCTAKADSSKVLFFPAAGRCNDGSVGNVGSGGYYWSSSLHTSNRTIAYDLFFSSGYMDWVDYNNRNGGYAVRGVLAE